MEVEKLYISLLADVEKFHKALEDARQDTNKTTTSIAGKFDALGTKMIKVGGAMSLGLTTPLVAMGTQAVNAASDLNETMSKVQVVFGDTSNQVLKFGEDSATALGMSKNEALSAAGTYGNLFVSMGMTTKKSADMSMSLVQLASDLASFNNIDTSDALEKLRAGLTGESEPLKTLGVNINQAMIENKAMEMGLIKTKSELDANAKAQAVYALILDQTKTAQGDFARTSDGLANSTRIAKAEFENVKATLGQALLPVVTDVMKQLIPLLQWFNALPPSTKETIVSVLGVVAALGPVITVGGTVSKTVGGLISLFGTGGGLAGVGTFLSGTVLPAVGGALAAVGLPVIALVVAIGLLIAAILIFGKDAWNTVTMIGQIIKIEFGRAGDFIRSSFVSAFNAVSKAIQTVIDWISNLGKKLLDLVIPDWLQMHSPPPLATALSMVGDEMKNLSTKTIPLFESQIGFSGYVMSPQAQNMGGNSQFAELISALQESGNKDTFDYTKFSKILVAELNKVMG